MVVVVVVVVAVVVVVVVMLSSSLLLLLLFFVVVFSSQPQRHKYPSFTGAGGGVRSASGGVRRLPVLAVLKRYPPTPDSPSLGGEWHLRTLFDEGPVEFGRDQGHVCGMPAPSPARGSISFNQSAMSTRRE